MGNQQGKENSNNKHYYGWKKDRPDERDQFHDFSSNKMLRLNLIDKIDLRSKCPPIYDQGNLGSCTANAIAAAYEFDMMHEFRGNDQAIIPFTPSRLFIYYNERAMEGSISEDAGAEIRDGIKSLNAIGICSEELYPYDISKFTEKPADKCYELAKGHKAVAYKKVNQNLNDMKQTLVLGYPIVFGFSVYESFETLEMATTGKMTIPKADETLLGGHAVMAVGYDDEKQVFIVRNSWSEKWGDKGYFYMPYSFITNPDYASDFWTVFRTHDQVST